MKQGKRLTLEQKKIVSSHYMNAKEWSLVSESEFYLRLVNKRTGDFKTIDKFLRRKNNDSRY